jgi:hypothetical protein
MNLVNHEKSCKSCLKLIALTQSQSVYYYSSPAVSAAQKESLK